MPDYIYLLENRLSADQQSALRHLRDVARDAGMLLFLVGDAVRDLTSGHAVRDIEVAVQGNALKLKKPVEKLGARVWGIDDVFHSLYLCFPGTVRVDLTSTHHREYPKPGKPTYRAATIQEDLRRRDFTVNAMAISLNEGSFGLLMDPLNGAADIETRTLRLVSNYGFLEQPSLLIRATRYRVRLGWEMDPRTHVRYENAREEGVISHLNRDARSYELEQIGHESEALNVLRALESEGWMKHLFPAWTSAKADEQKLDALHDLAVELLMQGVHPDMSAAQMQLLTAKLSSKDVAALKKHLLRPGFVEEWTSLDDQAAHFSKILLSKENQAPSACFKLFMSYDPEAVLWLGFTSKAEAARERYNQFLKVWPEVRQQIPHALMQEMRITPELPNYDEIVHLVFLELIDGRLTTPEETRAFLEPYSPPAPPPQITIKRSRARRSAEAKAKERSYEDEEEEELGDEGEGEDEDLDLDDIGGDEEEQETGAEEEYASDRDEEGAEEEAPEVKRSRSKTRKTKTVAEKPAREPAPSKAPEPKKKEKAPVPKPAKAEKPAKVVEKAKKVTPAPAKAVAKAKPAAAAPGKAKPASKVAAPKAVVQPARKAKPAAAKAAAQKPSAKVKTKPAARASAKAHKPVKATVQKPAAKKAAPAKKRSAPAAKAGKAHKPAKAATLKPSPKAAPAKKKAASPAKAVKAHKPAKPAVKKLAPKAPPKKNPPQPAKASKKKR